MGPGGAGLEQRGGWFDMRPPPMPYSGIDDNRGRMSRREEERMSRIEHLVACQSQCGESPIWDPVSGRL